MGQERSSWPLLLLAIIIGQLINLFGTQKRARASTKIVGGVGEGVKAERNHLVSLPFGAA
jgi:hypothetical protein